MTYLELCQAVRREAGIAGTGPVSVENQTGMYANVVRWVARAWTEIQSRSHQWAFLLSDEATASLVQDSAEYTGASFSITDLRHWSLPDLRVHDSTEGIGSQVRLIHKPWHWFQDRVLRGEQRSGFPEFVTITPQRKLRIYPAPDSGNYVLTYRYYKQPVTLAANADTPAAPAWLHEIIVQLALTYYAAHDNAPETYADAGRRYEELLNRLQKESLPEIEYAVEPLA